MTLFNRVWSVEVSDGSSSKKWERKPDGPGLDMVGTVEKTSDGSPNELEIKLYNLNKDSKSFLARSGLTITVSAGYENGQSGVIFKGTTEIPRNYRDGVDRVTEIKAKDGAFILRNVRIKKSFKKDVSKEQILLELIRSLTDARITTASLVTVAGLQVGTQKTEAVADKKTKKSKVVMGSVWKEIESIIKSYNLQLLITDQTIHIKSPTDPLNSSPIELNYGSGLVEIPEELDDSKGYRIKSLLRHEFNPGVQIIVETKDIQRGRFNIDYVKHDFDTRGNNWYTEIEARTQ